MKRITLLFLFVIFMVGLCSCQSIDSEPVLVWKIKTEKTEYTAEGFDHIELIENDYDGAGNLIEKHSYVNGEQASVTAYERDADGALLSEILTTSDGAVITNNYTYNYNDAGQLLSMQITSGGNTVSKTEYTYDEAGNAIRSTSTTYSGGAERVTALEMEYDDLGRIVMVTTIMDNDVLSIEHSHYSDEGMLTETIATDADGNVTSTTEHSYHGDTQTQTVTDALGNETFRYVLKTDKDGNLGAI